MPERFEIYIVYKRRYTNTLPFLFCALRNLCCSSEQFKELNPCCDSIIGYYNVLQADLAWMW